MQPKYFFCKLLLNIIFNEKNVDFNDTKRLHSNRNNVHIVAKSKPSFRSIKSSINLQSSPRTPPILVTSNDVPPISTSVVSMEKFNVENFHREKKKLNRIKLRNVQTLLDNQINKSVTHKQVYVIFYFVCFLNFIRNKKNYCLIFYSLTKLINSFDTKRKKFQALKFTIKININ